MVKQALPYVRLVGDSWPLPLKRSFFEYHALTRQQARAPGSVPAILHFDEGQALIVMEYLAPPHVILRRALIDGRELPNLSRDIGLFMARTRFRGSDLSMVTKERKADLALALSVILLGLLMMIARRNAISQVVGFMSLENGLILAAAGAKGMPLVVEISVAFSVLIAFIVIGVFLFRIRERFDSIDTQALDDVRGGRE